MLSVIVPSHPNEPYLQSTVSSLLARAGGEVEVVVVLDGYWTTLESDPRVRTVHLGSPVGMRGSINAGVAASSGEYIMKLDAHCLMSKLYDLRFVKHTQDNWISVPPVYQLSVEKWAATGEPREFQYIEKETLKGRWWPEHRADGDVVDLMTFQGSCWFMAREYFYQIGGLDEENYGGMGREAQELSLKAWTTGGRVVLNRRIWYAHWNKPKAFSLGKPGKEKSIAYAQGVWTEEKLRPLIKKFNPPSW
jgi:glycosyltransferase involved in cell wall biosynthesis